MKVDHVGSAVVEAVEEADVRFGEVDAEVDRVGGYYLHALAEQRDLALFFYLERHGYCFEFQEECLFCSAFECLEVWMFK